MNARLISIHRMWVYIDIVCYVDFILVSPQGLNKLKQGICSASEELIRFIIIECRIKMDHLVSFPYINA